MNRDALNASIDKLTTATAYANSTHRGNPVVVKGLAAAINFRGEQGAYYTPAAITRMENLLNAALAEIS